MNFDEILEDFQNRFDRIVDDEEKCSLIDQIAFHRLITSIDEIQIGISLFSSINEQNEDLAKNILNVRFIFQVESNNLKRTFIRYFLLTNVFSA